MENMPVVTSDQPVAYVASKRGNQLLLDPFNFLYCRDKQVGNREYWHCVRKSSKNKPWCPGKAVTEGGFIKYTRAHNHPSDPIDVGIRQKKEKVLKMVQTHPEMKTSQALNAWAQETSAPEDRSKAVSLKSMERTVQRVKAQAQDHPAVPQDYTNLELLPEKFCKTWDGERFLLSNVLLDNGDRVLLFSSPFGLDLLRKSSTWGGDGTFSVTPKPFYQLYTLLAEINGHSYPAAFAFLPNKRSPTYKVMLTELKSHLLPTEEAELKLENYLVDFESPMIKEFRATFGSRIRITGCYVHFRRNLWKRLGLVQHMLSLYCKQRSFHIFVNCIAGLAFVPSARVPEFYKALVESQLPIVMSDLENNEADFDKEAKASIRESIELYLDYIESTYVGKQGRMGWTNPRYPPEIWSQYENALTLEQRTTNRNEVWHSVLRNAVPLNASLWTVIDQLIKYEGKVRVMRDEHRDKFNASAAKEEQEGMSKAQRRRSDNDVLLRNLVSQINDFGKVEYLSRITHIKQIDC